VTLENGLTTLMTSKTFSFQPSLVLEGKVGAYPRVEHLKGASLGSGTGRQANHASMVHDQIIGSAEELTNVYREIG
jgi:hypothetical protein